MFTGFTEQAVDFLWNLRLNNSKEWFLAHKEDYETLIHQPTKALAGDLLDYFQEKYRKRNWNVHISRIYRDARRLYGRGPMNDHLWFTLFADGEKDGMVPAFYFSFQPDNYHYGMGCWTQNGELMQRLREDIARNPKTATRLAKAFEKQEVFHLDGELYKKHKMETTPLLQPWVDRKYLGFHRECLHGEAGFGAGLYDTVREGFDLLMPYFDYFMTLAKRQG